MGGLTTTYAGTLIGFLVGPTSSLTKPTWYMALVTSTTSAAAGGTEATGGSYARTAIGTLTVTTNSATNAADIQAPWATADWGTIVGADFYDASTAGNRIAWSMLASSVSILNKDRFIVRAGDLVTTQT